MDRFDRLVQRCVVLDIEASLSAKELFRQVAAELAPRLHVDDERLYELFLARERV